MVSIEVFVILAVGTLDLAIVPWRVGTNELMADASLFETRLEQAGTVVAGEQTFGELSAIVRLNAKNLERRSLDQVFQKLGGGIGAMLLKGFQIPPTGEFVNGSILVKLLTCGVSDDAGLWNKFHIDLNTLARKVHLFVRFWDVLGVWKLNSQLSDRKSVV